MMRSIRRAALVGTSDDVQGTIRTYPEALLARAVVVCEGASEVGLLRGLDQYEDYCARNTLAASGIVYIDGHGHNKVVPSAAALQSLGFATAILRDCDRPDTPAGEPDFIARGGRVFTWQAERALEDELFAELPDKAVRELLDRGVEKVGEPTVNDQIRSKSSGTLDLAACRGELTSAVRQALGAAARSKQGPWFKTVGDMETVAREVVGPALGESGDALRGTVEALRTWARDAAG